MTSRVLRWPTGILGPAPTLREVHFICWGLFVAFLAFPVYTVVRDHSLSGLQRSLDADFVYFYAMGRMLNEYPVERLYDYELQKQVCNEVHRLSSGTYGPIPYPPYTGLPFQALARMQYTTAYVLWQAASLILYLAGLAIVTKLFFPGDRLRQSLIFCFGLAFYPFTIELMVNGHLSAIGFFAIALALWEEHRGRPFSSGLALAICLYKPTLLVLIVPMLLVTRRVRTLAGFAAGGAGLFLFTLMWKGLNVWPGFLRMLLYFGEGSSGVRLQSFLRLRKYVDFTSFSSLAPGGRSIVGLAILGVVGAWALYRLGTLAWRSARRAWPVQTLVWATTLTWTLLLNMYVPMYDAILAVIGVVATAAVVRGAADGRLQQALTALWLATFVCSWITQPVAEATHIQLITLSFVALGLFQLEVLARMVAAPAQRLAATANNEQSLSR